MPQCTPTQHNNKGKKKRKYFWENQKKENQYLNKISIKKYI
jgi:hypothetical protein